ncbi:MAG: N-acetyltransferase [Verrucomicrobia bacterium]|jgi:N-acetylglutamate synthase-like GNAT family acetyltransferase|nr:N-acetyltransferase [Verrucomicrobiota bacterium]
MSIDSPFEKQIGDITVSCNKSRLDIAFIHGELSRTYWAQGIPRETLERAIANSLCFGVYRAGKQVGYAAVVTDQATFAWLCDVIIAENERGQGVGKLLIGTIITHPGLQGLRRFMLGTKDAHGLYAQFGFQPMDEPGRFMQIRNVNPYKLCLPNQAAGN